MKNYIRVGRWKLVCFMTTTRSKAQYRNMPKNYKFDIERHERLMEIRQAYIYGKYFRECQMNQSRTHTHIGWDMMDEKKIIFLFVLSSFSQIFVRISILFRCISGNFSLTCQCEFMRPFEFRSLKMNFSSVNIGLIYLQKLDERCCKGHPELAYQKWNTSSIWIVGCSNDEFPLPQSFRGL